MELGVKESSSPEVNEPPLPEAQQTLPRQPVSPGSNRCISTMDRDKRPPYTSSCRTSKLHSGFWELRSESRGMGESVNTSTPMKLWQRGHRGSAATRTKTEAEAGIECSHESLLQSSRGRCHASPLDGFGQWEGSGRGSWGDESLTLPLSSSCLPGFGDSATSLPQPPYLAELSRPCRKPLPSHGRN